MEQRHIGLELRSLNNLIHRRIEAGMNKKNIDNATGTNGWIIGYLAENSGRDIYQKDLEEEFTITRSTTSKVLNLMEQKGLVQRQSVPHDARLKKIVLTPKAMELTQKMQQDKEAIEITLTKGFEPEEIEQLLSYIERMKQNVRG